MFNKQLHKPIHGWAIVLSIWLPLRRLDCANTSNTKNSSQNYIQIVFIHISFPIPYKQSSACHYNQFIYINYSYIVCVSVSFIDLKLNDLIVIYHTHWIFSERRLNYNRAAVSFRKLHTNRFVCKYEINDDVFSIRFAFIRCACMSY